MEPYVFQDPLMEGIIIKRKSQFTLLVDHEGEVLSCRCPTNGRIGNMEITGRPCLIRRGIGSSGEDRYVVMAISLQRPEDANKSWIGIDQQIAPEIVSHFIGTGALGELGLHSNEARVVSQKGQPYATLTAGGDRIEVRVPLQELAVRIPDYIPIKHVLPSASLISDLRHITALAQGLPEDRKAVILNCFYYNNPGYRPVGSTISGDMGRHVVGMSIPGRVEIWQANFSVTREAVSLEKCFVIASGKRTEP